MSLDRASVRTVVLIGWSGFLFWLWVTDETLRYLGPRTQWLVPFGALTLAALAAANALAARGRPAQARPSARDLLGLAAMLLPIATGMLLAHSQLGALAASKKLTARGIDPAALAELASRNAAELSFLQINVAEKDPKFAAENNIRPGREVRLVGFVSAAAKHDHGPFELSRFYITCCVADSIPIGVAVRPADPRPATARRDQWLSVTGELVREGRRIALRATRVRSAATPKHPYLSFTS
jgi:uncharacterized repeat protein (TIGR03943 family)